MASGLLDMLVHTVLLLRCSGASARARVVLDVLAGMLVDAVLFALLWLLWRLSKWANHLARWFARRRRLRDYMPKALSPAPSTVEKQVATHF